MKGAKVQHAGRHAKVRQRQQQERKGGEHFKGSDATARPLNGTRASKRGSSSFQGMTDCKVDSKACLNGVGAIIVWVGSF